MAKGEKARERAAALRVTSIAALLMSALVLAACGDDPAQSPPPSSDREAIAQVINRAQSAVYGEDSEAMCALMSSLGKAALADPDQSRGVNGGDGSCSQFLRELVERGFGEGAFEPALTASDVDLSKTVRQGAADQEYVEVPCTASEGTSYFATEEDGSWRLLWPICGGR